MRRTPEPSKPNENGFVLAEAVVAVVIAAVAIGGALMALRQGQKLNREAMKRAEALALGESALRERLVAQASSLQPDVNREQAGYKIRITEARFESAVTVDGKPVQLGRTGDRFFIAQVVSRVSWSDGSRERFVALKALKVIDQAEP
jgi:Tfp pilus assembly protein PilV